MYIFYILLYFLNYTYCQANFLVATELTENYGKSYYCLTNSSSALAWISDDATTVQQGSHLIPNVEQKNIKLNEAATQLDGFIQNSLKGDINEVILDERWEGLTVYTTMHVRADSNILHFIPVISNLKNDFVIPLSIRAKEGHILLCDGEQVSTSNCYWILLQAFRRKITAIRKCKKNNIPLRNNSPIPDNCAKFRNETTHENNVKYLTNDSWSHFKLQKKENVLTLFWITKEKEKIAIAFHDSITDVINVTHMIVHSKTKISGFWKIHETTYTYITKKISESNPIFTELDLVDGSTCISMFVSMCASCSIKLSLKSQTHRFHLQEETIRNQKSGWNQVKYFKSNLPGEKVNLQVTTENDDNATNSFWAIDTSIRKCNKKEFRVLTAQIPFKCQLLSEDSEIISFSEKSNFADKDCIENSNKSFCVPLEWFPNTCQDRICTMLNSEEATCPAFIEDPIQNNCKFKTNNGSSFMKSMSLVIAIIITVIIMAFMLINFYFSWKRRYSLQNLGELEPTAVIITEHHLNEKDENHVKYVNLLTPISINDFPDYVKKNVLVKHELKNQYMNVLNRIPDVTYDEVGDNLFIDYVEMYGINENIKNAYLMARTPTLNNVDDFWKKVWDENIEHIVLIDNLCKTTMKNISYWREKEDFRCCGIIVQNYSTEIFANYEYRKFVLIKKNEIKYINHLRFTSWCNSETLDAYAFVQFFQKTSKIPLSSKKPILVHSSSNEIGFTLLCDMCLRTADMNGVVDVCGIFQKLSSAVDRIMINSLNEFKLVHLVILETLCYVDTSIRYTPLNQNALFGDSEIQTQMQYLESTKWLDEIPKNSKSNHESGFYFWVTSPEHNGQVLLTRRQEKLEITTAHCFRNYNQFIITKCPSSDSLRDFWRLIAEHNISLLIVLNDKESSHKTETWATKICKHGRPLKMMFLKFETIQNFDFYQLITLQMQYLQEFKTINILSLKNWPTTSDCPLIDVSDFVKFCVKSNTFLTKSNPVLVTCFDGVKASGLYVSMMYNMEKINAERVCDVSNSVRAVRRHCPQFISNNVQFKFLCKAVENFIETKRRYFDKLQ